jgi:hypothetical protein
LPAAFTSIDIDVSIIKLAIDRCNIAPILEPARLSGLKSGQGRARSAMQVGTVVETTEVVNLGGFE